MQKGEGTGFGLSVIGHIGLLALISLNLMSVRKMPKLSQPMDVMLVDDVGKVSGAPVISQEPPQAAEATEVADKVEEAPEPEAVTVPTPTPTPPKAKPKATSLGTDFLKGIPVAKSAGKAAAPRAAIVSPLAMNGLMALLQKQVLPCWNPPLGGIDTASIATLLAIRMKPDGTVALVEIGEQTGINDQNRAYARQMADAAKRAVLRCSPFDLPAELYEGGWDDFDYRFRPPQ